MLGFCIEGDVKFERDREMNKAITSAIILTIALTGCGISKERELELSNLKATCLAGNQGACTIYQTDMAVIQGDRQANAQAYQRAFQGLKTQNQSQPSIQSMYNRGLSGWGSRATTKCRRTLSGMTCNTW